MIPCSLIFIQFPSHNMYKQLPHLPEMAILSFFSPGKKDFIKISLYNYWIY